MLYAFPLTENSPRLQLTATILIRDILFKMVSVSKCPLRFTGHWLCPSGKSGKTMDWTDDKALLLITKIMKFSLIYVIRNTIISTRKKQS